MFLALRHAGHFYVLTSKLEKGIEKIYTNDGYSKAVLGSNKSGKSGGEEVSISNCCLPALYK